MRGGVLAREVVGVAGRHDGQVPSDGQCRAPPRRTPSGSARRCPGSRRRSSPRRRSSDTRHRAVRPRPACGEECSRKTRPTHIPTGRSSLRRAVRGSPCRSAACNRSLPGTTATTAASGCETPWRSWPEASDGRRAPARYPAAGPVRAVAAGRRKPPFRRSAGSRPIWLRGGTRRRRKGCRDRSRPAQACQGLGTVEQVRDLARPVQKAVVAMAMKMNKRPAGHRRSHLCCGDIGASCAAWPTPWLRGDPNVPVAVHTR